MNYLHPFSPSITPEELRNFLVDITHRGASDIYIQTGRNLGCRMEGVIHSCSNRQLMPQEVETLLVYTYGSDSGVTQVRSGLVLDYAWDFRLDRKTRLRFRVNCTGIWSDRGLSGYDLTFRALPGTTPTLEEVDLSPGIYDLCNPLSGIVLVAGGTGQGKSTTLAAIIGNYIRLGQGRVIDIQSPIEYTYQDIAGDKPHLALSEVPEHIPDFSEAVWAALRRSPDTIAIGETRDQATVRALIAASLTGHRVCSTIHAGNIVEIFRRFLSLTDSHGQITGDLPLVLRFLIAQRLLTGTNGRRQVVREYLEISDRVRQSLWQNEPSGWPRIISNILINPPEGTLARPFSADCNDQVTRGTITREVADNFLQSSGQGERQ